MKPVEFPEQSVVIAKDQPQYMPLPAYRQPGPDGRVICCWRLTWRERFHLLVTGRIRHHILTFHQPLQRWTTEGRWARKARGTRRGASR